MLTPRSPRITKYGIVIEQDYQVSNNTSQRIMKEKIADLMKIERIPDGHSDDGCPYHGFDG